METRKCLCPKKIKIDIDEKILARKELKAIKEMMMKDLYKRGWMKMRKDFNVKKKDNQKQEYNAG